MKTKRKPQQAGLISSLSVDIVFLFLHEALGSFHVIEFDN